MKKLLSLFFVGVLLLLLSCNKQQPTEPANNAPTIKSISAIPPQIKGQETTTVTCIATDADGDELSYIWFSNEGSFPNGASGPSVLWKAPQEEGYHIISVTASDVKETVFDSLIIWVGPPRCSGTPTVTYEGKTYHTVQIGDQCWFKENLDVGTMMQSTTSGYQQTDNEVIEKYCYNNNATNCDAYGGLYEWTEAMQYM